MVPIEIFSRNVFPTISDQPYRLTVGPHAFYWFSLEARTAEAGVAAASAPVLPLFEVEQDWQEVLEERALRDLEAQLQEYIAPRRWFGGKTHIIKSVRVSEAIAVPSAGSTAFLLFADIDYVQGDPERYLLPLAFAAGDEAAKLQLERPHLVIARLHINEGNVEGVLYDGIGSKDFAQKLLDTMGHRRVLKGKAGDLRGFALEAFRRLQGEGADNLTPLVGRAEQSNSAILFGDKFILKTFRRLEPGLNPDIEINRFLAKHDFPHVAAAGGGPDLSRPRWTGNQYRYFERLRGRTVRMAGNFR